MEAVCLLEVKRGFPGPSGWNSALVHSPMCMCDLAPLHHGQTERQNGGKRTPRLQSWWEGA